MYGLWVTKDMTEQVLEDPSDGLRSLGSMAEAVVKSLKQRRANGFLHSSSMKTPSYGCHSQNSF